MNFVPASDHCIVLHKIFNRYSDWLRAGRSGDWIPMGARFSAPVQTGPGAHPASCKMGTGSYPGANSGRGVTLTTHALLVPWSRKSTAIILQPLWDVGPVLSLSACTRVHFTLLYTKFWYTTRKKSVIVYYFNILIEFVSVVGSYITWMQFALRVL